MKIVVAVKQVLDPDGVNSYALWGRLEVDESGRSFATGGAVPQIINAYDEQAMEAAMRIRDAGVECTITAVSVGADSARDVLKRCVAMGADSAVLVNDERQGNGDGFRTAKLLAAVVTKLGDVDLVLSGRQGSDYDQGTVPGALAEYLDASLVTMASDVASADDAVRVTQVTPAGEQVVEATLPAVVSVSNEIGIPRYPTSRGMLAARRKPPEVFEAGDLLGEDESARVEIIQLSVPNVQGHCEVIEGDSPQAKAAALLEALTTSGALNG
jgi:electron transfer flavoprotein beta subunit